jgi:hypothetical protein
MSHILFRAIVGVVVVFPLVVLIAFLMAILNCAFWDMRRKHYYRAGSN